MPRARNRRWALAIGTAVLVLLFGGAMVRFVVGRSPKVLAPGTAVFTDAGKVAVYGWDAEGPDAAPDAPRGSVADVSSCQVEAGGTILNVAAFGLELPDGRRLRPVRSQVTGADSQTKCLRVSVTFPATDGMAPRYVTFSAEGATHRWPARPAPSYSPGSVPFPPKGVGLTPTTQSVPATEPTAGRT